MSLGPAGFVALRLPASERTGAVAEVRACALRRAGHRAVPMPRAHRVRFLTKSISRTMPLSFHVCQAPRGRSPNQSIDQLERKNTQVQAVQSRDGWLGGTGRKEEARHSTSLGGAPDSKREGQARTVDVDSA